jgi:arsenite methyltransferase
MVIIHTIHLYDGTFHNTILYMVETGERIQKIREAVRQAYSEVAERPEGEHPFPVGRCFAASVGYPVDLLSALPSVSVDAFSGVSNVSLFADIPVGATVLDLGCGAGLDSLIAARRVGKTGRVISIDFSEAMLARAREAAIEAQINNIEFKQAAAENLPIPNESIDIALLNGIFNLNPMREAIFRELGRVIRSGGAVYAAELILKDPLPSEFLNDDNDWFA